MKKPKMLDTYEKTRRVSNLLYLAARIGSYFYTKFEHVRIIKKGYIPKPPYLLISTHKSELDFAVGFKAVGNHKPYWISTVEEFINKNFLLRNLGVLPKRKFTNDPRCAKMAMEVLTKRKKILIIYPEARYSFVGKEERIDAGLGKLAKLCDVPIVFLNCYGHYLRFPQWGDRRIRKVSYQLSEMKCLYTKNDVREMDADEISQGIAEQFKTDDEQFQLDHNIMIDYPKRAEGIERILYKCPHCGKEYEMSSDKDTFKCDACGVQYKINEDGTISCENDEGKFNRISEWYYWEKECVRKEVEDGTYHFEDDVRVEQLIAVVIGFVPLRGKYHFTHSIKDGFTVTGGKDFTFNRSSLQSYGLHIEYNWWRRGNCFELSNSTETYFIYPLNKTLSITKLHFATEIIYDHLKSQMKNPTALQPKEKLEDILEKEVNNPSPKRKRLRK